jgi:uncharacterized protein YbcC (UPF0753/DUF2309 family)
VLTTTPEASAATVRDDRESLVRLERIVAGVGALLPAPGPIASFAFVNTLQALEELPFDEGMRYGARLYNCEPYLTEDRYREKMARGRIHPADLAAILRKSLADAGDVLIGSLVTRYKLRLAMLSYPLLYGPTHELRWYVEETEALRRFRGEVAPATRERMIEQTRRWVTRELRGNGNRSGGELPPREAHARKILADVLDRFGDSSVEHWCDPLAEWEALTLEVLWRVCRDGVERFAAPPAPARRGVRHRDLLRDVTSEDSDALVHAVLIRYCAAFCDQGFADWPLPGRDKGFYRSFFQLYGRAGGPPDRWRRGLARELARIEGLGLGPCESIAESLQLLGVDVEEWGEFIAATLLALRGWAGMLWQMEVRGDRLPRPAAAGTLLEFLAVRLILDRLALSFLANEALGYDGPLSHLRRALAEKTVERAGASVDQRALMVFQIAQLLEWPPPTLFHLARDDWSALVGEIEAFPSLDRRWHFHQAFERRYRQQALDAFSIYAGRRAGRPDAPRFQAVFCIDAREESFRRHLEEIAPDVETYGAPGFFGVPMYYRGAGDAHFTALCPIVVRPRHWVVEDVVYALEVSHRRRARTRRALGSASHQFHVGSRSIAGGALLAAGLGVLASAPLLARVVFPRLTAHLRRTASRWMEVPPVTRLRLERTSPTPGSADDQVGFTLDEMADLAERMLRDIGLTTHFSRLVMFVAHGAFCLNNPHKSAYDCGACTGNAGAPNSRALAAMLNDRRVRTLLAGRGLDIPAETHFLGGLHNTTVDSVRFFDLDALPRSHIPDFEAATRILEDACQRNAHERCRRFDSAPLDLTYAQAHQHVEGRSEDLAQPRPEFGNASNALCFVGRRARTRGLFLDRRAFMNSYDPTQDDAEHTLLARILSAVVPVCVGINMQYNLSYIDPPGWGCGTKLPHNVTSLLGVMNGHASDLQPGLPWQGVEIHEPIRLLFIVEATAAAMLSIMERNAAIRRVLANGWAQLAVLAPNSSEVHVYRNGAFHLHLAETDALPCVASSLDWYRGWRDHLGFAMIGGDSRR